MLAGYERRAFASFLKISSSMRLKPTLSNTRSKIRFAPSKATSTLTKLTNMPCQTSAVWKQVYQLGAGSEFPNTFSLYPPLTLRNFCYLCSYEGTGIADVSSRQSPQGECRYVKPKVTKIIQRPAGAVMAPVITASWSAKVAGSQIGRTPA